jgi:ATP-binding cassette subfamily B protein
VKAFGTESSEISAYTLANREALRAGVKDAWGNGFTSALTSYLDLGTGVLILFYGGLLVMDNQMSVGELVTFQLFWNMMNNAYQNLQNLVTSFTRSAAGAEKVFSLYDNAPDINPDVGDEISPASIRGALTLQNVKFFYQMRPDNLVLDSINLTIPAGKTVALVGRSGGGKSTIVNMLLRFYDPKQGSITLDGIPYETLKVSQLRALFGVVSQDTELFAKTISENIAYGLPPDHYTIEDVHEAARQAQCYDFISEMKDGFSTRVGERGSRLSGGQRQRIAIARVFLRKPKIILLDEATSALDENSQEAVQNALNLLISQSNATVVLVAHRLSTVMNADKICVIDKGGVVEEGSHEELVQLGGIYSKLVEKQNKKKANLLNQAEIDSTTEQKKKADDADNIDALFAK